MTAALCLQIPNKENEYADLKKSVRDDSSVRKFMIIDANGAQRRLQIYNGDFRSAHFDVKLKPVKWQACKRQLGHKRLVKLNANEIKNPVKDGVKKQQVSLKINSSKFKASEENLITKNFYKYLIKRLATVSLIVSSVFSVGALVGSVLQEPVIASGKSIIVTNEKNLWQIAKKINSGNTSVGDTVAKIMELNSLDNSILYPGQEIILPR